MPLLRHLVPIVLVLTLAASARAQDGIEIEGLASASFAYAFQLSDLDVGGELDDGLGLDAELGFQVGEHVAFTLGYQWQTNDDFDSHYFPVSMRAYSPSLLEIVRLYGTAGIGLFFTSVHNEFDANGNERAAAYHAGGGVSVAVTDSLEVLVQAKYLGGMGQVKDWESVVTGVGLEFRWGL